MSVKTLAISAIVGLTSANTHVLEAQLIVKGVLHGAFNVDVATNGCLTDSEGIYTQAGEIIADFKKMDVEGGFKVIGSMMTALSKDLGDCKTLEAGMKTKLDAMGAVFSKPSTAVKTVGWNIIKHHTEILKEDGVAISDYDAKNWYDMGVNLG
jgi:hypothetical protein